MLLMATLSYKQHPLEDNWDSIVIGSGIGGLTAAALLAKHGGKRVLVLERHYVAGGFTHVFHRPGYEWDVGVHYIGETRNPASRVRAAFDHVTEGRLTWNPMPDIYDEFRIGDQVYQLPSGAKRYQQMLKTRFPGETAAIDGYLSAVEASERASQLYYAEKAIPSVAAKVAGSWMRSGYVKWASRTTAEVLGELTNNRELIAVLTAQWGNYGLPPSQSSFSMHATVVRHYFAGGNFPVGGAARIAESILPVIERAGGKVVVSAEVDQILVEGGCAVGVRMAGGREFRAPLILSDAGAANTYSRLLPPETAGVEDIRTELQAIGPSMSHICLYAGLDRTASELGFTGTNLWVHPSNDYDRNLNRFLENPAAPFPVLFISFPSAKDPEFESRHPGHSTIEVITTVPYALFERWEKTSWKKRGEEYDLLKRSFTERLSGELQRLVPSTVGHLAHAELSTPLSTRNFVNYSRGEVYGIRATPARFQLRSLGARTPVRQLLLTGQDVASLGVTGALFGGAIAASVALGRNLVSKVTKGAQSEAA